MLLLVSQMEVGSTSTTVDSFGPASGSAVIFAVWPMDEAGSLVAASGRESASD